MEITELYKLFLSSNGITTDSRKIADNQIYFALKGDNFNGNKFAQSAIEQGAAFAIIDEVEYQQSQRHILVENVLQTLQALAHYHIIQIKPKAIIAITGSNGKTTTKELVHAVLATTFKTHYTKGNLNNHIGIPITLLEMEKDTEIAVIEMGANHQKEIESYCKYVEPTHGIITNCGKAHLEGFGGTQGIRNGKGELYDYLKQHQGTVFVNGDDAILLDMIKEKSITASVKYGKNNSCNYSSKILVENPFLKILFEDIEINSNLFGSYNYSNIMCAIAVGKYFGVTVTAIKNAIEAYKPTNARSQMIEKNGYHLILDAYNANPTSMQHALESFAKSDAERKIVLLGDMFELGDDAMKEHQFIADLCSQLNFETIVLVGNAFMQTTTPSYVLKFPDTIAAKEWFQQQNMNEATLLLKGSRGMKMELIIS